MIKSELVQAVAARNPHLYHRDVENIVNHTKQMVAAIMNVMGVALIIRTAKRAEQVFHHDFRKADNRVQGGTQFMTHGGQELRFGAVGHFGGFGGGA